MSTPPPLPCTDARFIEIVKDSKSIAGVLRGIGYSHQSTAYRFVRRHINRLSLDTTHFTGQSHGKSGRTHFVPTEELLQRTATAGTHLKHRLVREGLLPYECAECGLSEWRGKSLSLQIDHIDGDRSHNRIENLRLLCPNCHTQTPTFGSRGRKRPDVYNRCADCNTEVHRTSIRCRRCAKRAQGSKTPWPDYETLRADVVATSLSAVGRTYGVSPNAVAKRLKTHAPIV